MYFSILHFNIFLNFYCFQIYELSKIGGESVKQKIFNALKFLITNKLASCMTYAGIKKNKRGFKTLQLHNIVIGKFYTESLLIYVF